MGTTIGKMFAAAVLAVSLCACGSKEKSEPVTGSWTLDKVMAAEPGKEAEFKDRESNNSLYGEGETVYTFNADGSGKLTVTAGPDTVEFTATWKKTDAGYVFTDERNDSRTFTYEAADDTLRDHFKDDSADAKYSDVEFIFVRKK